MRILEGLFGRPKKEEGRPNDGGNFMAVPGPENMTGDKEAQFAEMTRLEKEALERSIVEIEGNPNHERYGELNDLRDKLRVMNEPFK